MLVGLGGAAASAFFDKAQHRARIEELLRPTCVAAGPAVGYLGWDRDNHTFVFHNRDYVDALRAENPGAIQEAGEEG